MIAPDVTENEKVRLKALHSLRILDTSPEERFDRLTRLAQHMFTMPMAVVSLVDQDRQWFKSSCGLSVNETPRDISFCGHTILNDEPMVIPDATKDTRFFDNPLVTGELGIRFYAGAPINDASGNILGTLCLIDTKTRAFTKNDVMALKDLAELASRELIAVELATQDDLTKLLNRRGFMVKAKRQLHESAENGDHSVYISLDLNNFKSINDEFGHAEGDHALKYFADVMRSIFRGTDLMARVGGDEFAVMLSSKQIVDNSLLLSRFQNAIRNDNEGSDKGYDLSFSYGAVAIDPRDKVSLDKIMREADAFMYRDKKSAVDRLQNVYRMPKKVSRIQQHSYL